MKIYITNHSNEIINSTNRKAIYIHYDKKCKRLNSDYNVDGEYAPNSGIKELNFSCKKDLLEKLTSSGTFTLCKECETIEDVKSWDEFLIQEKQTVKLEDEFLKEAIEEYDRLKSLGAI